MDVPLAAVIAIVGPMLALIGTLIIINLKSIKTCIGDLVDRTDGQDDAIKALTINQGVCKIDCERRFVDSEIFLRETGYQRRVLERQSEMLNRMDGKLIVVEKMPQIAADIARAVVKEFKNGEPT